MVDIVLAKCTAEDVIVDLGEQINKRIDHLFRCDDAATESLLAHALFGELLALPECSPVWKIIDPDDVLALVDFHGDAIAVVDFKAIMAKVFPHLQMPWQFAYWRSLSVLHVDYSDPIWALFWEDFVSDDDLRFANASAIVAPGLKRHDPYFEQKIDEIWRSSAADDLVRSRIERLLFTVAYPELLHQVE